MKNQVPVSCLQTICTTVESDVGRFIEVAFNRVRQDQLPGLNVFRFSDGTVIKWYKNHNVKIEHFPFGMQN